MRVGPAMVILPTVPGQSDPARTGLFVPGQLSRPCGKEKLGERGMRLRRETRSSSSECEPARTWAAAQTAPGDPIGPWRGRAVAIYLEAAIFAEPAVVATPVCPTGTEPSSAITSIPTPTIEPRTALALIHLSSSRCFSDDIFWKSRKLPSATTPSSDDEGQPPTHSSAVRRQGM